MGKKKKKELVTIPNPNVVIKKIPPIECPKCKSIAVEKIPISTRLGLFCSPCMIFFDVSNKIIYRVTNRKWEKSRFPTFSDFSLEELDKT